MMVFVFAKRESSYRCDRLARELIRSSAIGIPVGKRFLRPSPFKFLFLQNKKGFSEEATRRTVNEDVGLFGIFHFAKRESYGMTTPSPTSCSGVSFMNGTPLCVKKITPLEKFGTIFAGT